MQATNAAPAPQSPFPARPAIWNIEPFVYPVLECPVNAAIDAEEDEPELADWKLGEELETDSSSASGETENDLAGGVDDVSENNEQLLAEAREQGYEAGLRQGREEGRTEAREQFLAEQAEQNRVAGQQRQSEFARLVENFDVSRERYLQQVEPEVVRLALAVAARILRREAQMDPLLLTGAVRVALGQIASSSKVRLKVPAADLPLWTEAIAHLPKLAVRPEVVAGESMRLGDCVMETELGSVDLGFRAQLSEIERGFFDRPGFAASSPMESKEESA